MSFTAGVCPQYTEIVNPDTSCIKTIIVYHYGYFVMDHAQDLHIGCKIFKFIYLLTYLMKQMRYVRKIL